MPVRVLRIRKWHLAALILLVFLFFILSGVIESRMARRNITAMSWALAHRVVVVDPGHGGVDPGVVGDNGVLEKDINLAVARLLADNLGQAGAKVLMTREGDNDLSDPETKDLYEKKKEDLKRRVALANEQRADFYLSLHVNSYPASDRRGAQTFTQPGSEESQEAGQFIQEELARVLKNTDRLPKEVDYYITRNTNMPSVIVEIGFITNKAEEKLIMDPAYQSKVAWAIYAGMVRYFAQKGTSKEVQLDKEEIIKTFKEQEPVFISEP